MALPKRTNHMGREGVQTQAWTGISHGRAKRRRPFVVPAGPSLWRSPRGIAVPQPELADKGEWKARRRRRWASRLWRLGRPAQHRDELCHRRGMGGYTVL